MLQRGGGIVRFVPEKKKKLRKKENKAAGKGRHSCELLSNSWIIKGKRPPSHGTQKGAFTVRGKNPLNTEKRGEFSHTVRRGGRKQGGTEKKRVGSSDRGENSRKGIPVAEGKEGRGGRKKKLKKKKITRRKISHLKKEGKRLIVSKKGRRVQERGSLNNKKRYISLAISPFPAGQEPRA